MSEPRTLLELTREATRYLSRKGIPSPRLDVEVLMAHVLDCRRIDLYLRHDQPLHQEELDRFREAIRRRSKREPVAYITGIKEFWSLRVGVTPEVLIPRPETELLVEVTLEALRERSGSDGPPLRVLEIGTGSGAVAVAVAVALGDRVEVWATDCSQAATRVAQDNARGLGVEERIRFLHGDLFAPLPRDAPPFAVILSNPPYVSGEEMSRLAPEIRDYEPSEALHGGVDGLGVIRRLILEAPSWVEGEGLLLVEIGAGQRMAVESTLQGVPGWREWRWHRDLAGRDRVLAVKRAPRSRGAVPATEDVHG